MHAVRRSRLRSRTGEQEVPPRHGRQARSFHDDPGLGIAEYQRAKAGMPSRELTEASADIRSRSYSNNYSITNGDQREGPQKLAPTPYGRSTTATAYGSCPTPVTVATTRRERRSMT